MKLGVSMSALCIALCYASVTLFAQGGPRGDLAVQQSAKHAQAVDAYCAKTPCEVSVTIGDATYSSSHRSSSDAIAWVDYMRSRSK